MPFVLDASVAANWLLPDEPPLATEAWRRAAEDDILVPGHWWFEVRNIALVAERRGRIPAKHTSYLLQRLSLMRIDEAPHPDDETALALARNHNLSFYDAAYLELAQRLRIPLATLDKRLADAARTEKASLILEP